MPASRSVMSMLARELLATMAASPAVSDGRILEDDQRRVENRIWTSGGVVGLGDVSLHPQGRPCAGQGGTNGSSDREPEAAPRRREDAIRERLERGRPNSTRARASRP
jgi:hypothetical protein